jgi:hypothetical protein
MNAIKTQKSRGETEVLVNLKADTVKAVVGPNKPVKQTSNLETKMH